ncbi:DMT family transporter [Lacinutrix chionoecetis]
MLKKAVQYMVISAIAFTFMNVFVKYLTNFSAYQIVFFRSVGTLFFTMPFLLKNNISILGNNKGLLVLRGVVGAIAMTLFFASLNYLAVGTAVSLRYLSPIFAAVFALFILKEKIKPIQWLYFIIAFLGVVILKGFSAEMSDLGLLFILLSAILTGLVFIIIRKIGDKDHPVVVVNYFMIIAVIFGGILSINNWVQPKGMEWLILLSLGIFGYYGQLYMTKAFQISETNIVAPFKYIEVIFTMIIGIIWLNDSYTLISYIGIILIIVALVLNVLVKSKKP